MRYKLVLTLLAVICVCIAFLTVTTSTKNEGEEVLLVRELGKMKEHLQSAQLLNEERTKDVWDLSQHFSDLISGNRVNSSTILLDSNAQSLLDDITQKTGDLQIPSAQKFLPHLLDNPGSIYPIIKHSKNRKGVSLALGIPTVHRNDKLYVLDTVESLLNLMSEEERCDILIVVIIADTDTAFIDQVTDEVSKKFGFAIDSGLLEVIAPASSYYLGVKLPAGNKLPEHKVKQSLDFVFAATYCQTKGTLYVHLTDDIIATESGFIETMKTTALKELSTKKNWFLIDFCSEGFFGKLFKASDVAYFVQFILLFYKEKPIDVLLDNMLQTRLCRFDKGQKMCKAAKAAHWIMYKRNLFHHTGDQSSYNEQNGLTQYIKHKNPKAKAVTAIQQYKTHTLQKAYDGQGFFWGLLPGKGNTLLFQFEAPQLISHYAFHTGNTAHPKDKIVDAVVEILPIEQNDFVTVGQFDKAGVAQGSLDKNIGPLQAIRVRFTRDIKTWVIVSKISVDP